MEYYSAIGKDEYLPFARTWMGQQGIMLSDIRQAEKDNDHMVSLMRNIRNSTEDLRGRDGNLKGEKSEREMNHEKL